MPYVFQTAPDRSFLAEYRLPKLSFAARPKLSAALAPIWQALQEERLRAALQLVRTATPAPKHRAALLVAQAAAEWRSGNAEVAKRLAEQSLARCPTQWAAHRLLLEMLMAQHAHEAAYLYLSTLALPQKTTSWDEPLPPVEQQLAAASRAWLMSDWASVAVHLTKAYPDGVAEMPAPLQEDWFRLALYRNRPEDAAAAASCLIAEGTLEFSDALLQTIVQQGWTQYALPLYRTAFTRAPENPLLRRRLVALCIREGAIEEARTLAQPRALDMSAGLPSRRRKTPNATG